jgi:flagellar hook-associated protein 1 FlgK
VPHVYSALGDITSQLSGGELGGILTARDQSIPTVQGQLDSLASGLSQALNTAHQKGFDLNGNPGGNLFTPVAGTGAAAKISLAFTDPALLAASSDGSTGSNGNLAKLSAVANQTVARGMTPAEDYGDIVATVGSSANDASTELQASNNTLQQLQQQADSVSGVSLDEEASNLLLYQRAYQAAAQAVVAVDQMLQTALKIGTGV